jgi:hypothetical protein
MLPNRLTSDSALTARLMINAPVLGEFVVSAYKALLVQHFAG